MRGIVFALTILFFVTPVFAQHSVTVEWDAPAQVTGVEVVGYKLYMGASSGAYPTTWDVGNVTRTTISGLSYSTDYYLVATTYGNVLMVDGTVQQMESAYSTELYFSTPAPPPPVEYCGDFICGLNETCSSCPGDCGSCPILKYCGDGICNGVETYLTCPVDCPLPAPWCGDGICNGYENWRKCPADCKKPGKQK